MHISTSLAEVTEKLSLKKEKLLVAAPMAGISNRPFRRLMKQLGSDWSVSELISAKGLVMGGQKTRLMIKISEDERPVGIQLFGDDIPSLLKASQIVQEGGADFIDINFGCPVPKVVSRGGGAAWLCDPKAMGDLLKALVANSKIPISIKIRTGWDQNSRNALEVCEQAQELGIAWVAIHGRTRSQGYSGKADWEFIDSIAKNVEIPIIGNGDILSKKDIEERSQTSCAALMIGRGVLHDPLLMTTPTHSYLDVFLRYLDLAREDFEDYFLLLQAKKMAAWYSSGIPYGNQFRRDIFAMKDLPSIVDYAKDFLFQKSSLHRQEAPQLLMGGHG